MHNYFVDLIINQFEIISSLTIESKEIQKEILKLFLLGTKDLNIPTPIVNKLIKLDDSSLNYNIIWKMVDKYNLETDKLSKINDYYKLKSPKKKSKELLHIFVQRLEPVGEFSMLPSKEVYTKKSAYIFSNHTPYLLTLSSSRDDKKDEFYSEQNWVDKETAILIALINLSKTLTSFSFFIEEEGFAIPLTHNHQNIKSLNKHSVEKIKNLIELYGYINRLLERNKSQIKQNNFQYSDNINLHKIEKLNKLIDRNNNVLGSCTANSVVAEQFN